MRKKDNFVYMLMLTNYFIYLKVSAIATDHEIKISTMYQSK